MIKLKKAGDSNENIGRKTNRSAGLVGFLLEMFMKDYNKYKYNKLQYKKFHNTKKIALGNPFHKNIDYNKKN